MFHIEGRREPVRCLLNPESIELRRAAAIRRRNTVGGFATGRAAADDALIATGGGRTEITLDLLFDIALNDGPNAPTDVGVLTRPIHALAENSRRGSGYAKPPTVRFFWGKTWNIPGVVEAVSERLERFSPNGEPARSWLRIRLLRISEPTTREPPDAGTAADAGGTSSIVPDGLDVQDEMGEDSVRVCGERLDQLAGRFYGDARLWRPLAVANGIDDPQNLPTDQVLTIPPRSELEGLV